MEFSLRMETRVPKGILSLTPWPASITLAGMSQSQSFDCCIAQNPGASRRFHPGILADLPRCDEHGRVYRRPQWGLAKLLDAGVALLRFSPGVSG